MKVRFLRTKCRALLTDPEPLRALAVSTVAVLCLFFLVELWLRPAGR